MIYVVDDYRNCPFRQIETDSDADMLGGYCGLGNACGPVLPKNSKTPPARCPLRDGSITVTLKEK